MLFRAIVFAGVAVAAQQNEVVSVAHSESPQAMEQLVATVQTIGRYRPGEVVAMQNAISVSGTGGQARLARWLIGVLDKPADAPPPVPAAQQYSLDDGSGEIVKVIHLAQSASRLQLMEVMTAMRTITELRSVNPFESRKAVSLRGSADQVRLAEWMFAELDRPAGAPPPADSNTHQYLVKDGTGDVVRLFYVAHSERPQNLQELMTLIRTMTDIRRVFPVSTRNTLSWRGTADQIQLVEWLVNELDQPAASPLPPNSPERQYRVQDKSGEVVRVFHLPQAKTPRDLDEVMTLIRTLTGIRRAFPHRVRKALGFRGTPDQMRLCDWLVSTLENPPGPGLVQMTVGDEQVSVFFLPPSRSSQELQDMFGSVRAATAAPRMFFTEAQRAIAIRGTPAQIATAQRMIEQP